MENDEIVSGWRNGADSVDGLENPAGPLYIEGEAAVEAAMTKSRPTFNASYTAITCNSPYHNCVCT